MDVLGVRCGHRRGGLQTSPGHPLFCVWAVLGDARCYLDRALPNEPPQTAASAQTRAGGHGFRGPRVAGRLLPRPVRGRRHLLRVPTRHLSVCLCPDFSGGQQSRGVRPSPRPHSGPATSGPGLPHLDSGDTVPAWLSRVHHGRRCSGGHTCEGRLRKWGGGRAGGERAPSPG